MTRNKGQQVVHWRGGEPVRSYYEGARTDLRRKQRKETGSANSALELAGRSLREQARHFDQSSDLAHGILNTLVQNTVGATGITVEPMPRDRSGKMLFDLAAEIKREIGIFSRRPEVTWEHTWPACQRLMARSRYRDGEAFAQHLAGSISGLDHGKPLNYSIEMIESDMVPMDETILGDRRIRMGVELNAWNRITHYHVYKHHPGDLYSTAIPETKRVRADRMMHTKMVHRIGQIRGVSIFAPVLIRLDDIKDYEDSERIAAKVAASMAAYIKKGSPDIYDEDYDEDEDYEPRNMRFRPGMVFDDLYPGEDIGTIDTNRPNTNLEAFRNGQLRMAASATSTTFSSIAKTYDGTFSAQRQELVEGYGAYQILAVDNVDQFVRPTIEKVIAVAVQTGRIRLPSNIDEETLYDAMYIAPQMPWVDPVKEATGYEILKNEDLAAPQEIIRKRGQDPVQVLDQKQLWDQMMRDRNLVPDDNSTESNDAARTRSQTIQD